jgi:hypothetical protein
MSLPDLVINSLHFEAQKTSYGRLRTEAHTPIQRQDNPKQKEHGAGRWSLRYGADVDCILLVMTSWSTAAYVFTNVLKEYIASIVRGDKFLRNVGKDLYDYMMS